MFVLQESDKAGADCDHSVHPLLAATLGHTASTHIPTTRPQPGGYHCGGECSLVTQLALISQQGGEFTLWFFMRIAHFFTKKSASPFLHFKKSKLLFSLFYK